MALATGGTITYDGDYVIHTFTGNGSFNVPGIGLIDFLLIGGGAGGRHGGGGGAGQVQKQTSFKVTSKTNSIIIGIAGVARPTGTGSSSENNGGQSSAFGYTASGGLLGFYGSISDDGRGGQSGNSFNGGIGASGSAGGGGGSTGVGGNATSNVGGSAGAGFTDSISGSSVVYAKGGPGAGASSIGSGGVTTYGSGGHSGFYSNATNGQQGVCIIRYHKNAFNLNGAFLLQMM